MLNKEFSLVIYGGGGVTFKDSCLFPIIIISRYHGGNSGPDNPHTLRHQYNTELNQLINPELVWNKLIPAASYSSYSFLPSNYFYHHSPLLLFPLLLPTLHLLLLPRLLLLPTPLPLLLPLTPPTSSTHTRMPFLLLLPFLILPHLLFNSIVYFFPSYSFLYSYFTYSLLLPSPFCAS